MSDLTLHHLGGSPNSIKVRIGLAYKGLDYTPEEFQLDGFPGNRDSMVTLSHQPRLPVLKHGDTVIFDSGGILRYLEANFPGTPRLFSDDHAKHGEIDGWEVFSRSRIGEAIGMLFGQAFGGSPDADVIAKANALLNERLADVESALGKGEFLTGDALTFADIVVAAPLYLADLTDENAASHPVAAFFKQNLSLGEGREKTRAWIRRVLAYDPIKGKRPAVV
jgi:glutathione S-transferase